jgi:hypothetical protein
MAQEELGRNIEPSEDCPRPAADVDVAAVWEGYCQDILHAVLEG